MLTYIFRRILLMIPTLIGITIVVFSVMALSPGGISPTNLFEGNLNPKEREVLIEYYNKRYGLDKPAPIQYLRWLNNILPVGFTSNQKGEYSGFSFIKGSDLGTSFHYGRGVGEILVERLPITLLLNLLSIPVIYIFALLIGIRAATERGGKFDVVSNISMLALWSMPTMLAGVLLLGFFANIQHWQWFPTAGLHSRTALDMPFLPQGLGLFDILFFGLLIIVAIFISRIIVAINNKIIFKFTNLLISILISLGLGSSHAAPDLGLWIILIILTLVLFLAFNAINHQALYRIFYSIFFSIFITILFFTQKIKNFEIGYILDLGWHLFLPIICLSYAGFAGLAKLTRASVLENLQADYVRTARAKGLSEKYILYKHVFRNSLLPLITVTAGLLPSLLAGSLIVENIFSINGMGQLAVEAVKNRDRELVLSITWISGFLTLAGYLIADFFYTLADPRVSYE